MSRIVGRYAIHDEIAAGGMATVHLGRLLGPVGFSRTVAIKRLHAQFAREPDVVAMFLDEARLAARIRHPNVVSTLDVVEAEGEIFLVMEYVQGESLSSLVRMVGARHERIPPRIVASVLAGCLHGLHAAHEAKDERGAPLEIVHRDVSPQNMLVGVDGISHLLDFGIAKAAGSLGTTREGHIRGKLAYMAPEQFHGQAATRQSDVFGAAIVLWELLAGEPLFCAGTDAAVLERVLFGTIPPIRSRAAELPEAIAAVLERGLDRDVTARYATAREMALDLEAALGVASPTEVARWLDEVASGSLATRAGFVAEVERGDALGERPDVLLGSEPARRVETTRPESLPAQGRLVESEPATAVAAWRAASARSRWPRALAVLLVLTLAVIGWSGRRALVGASSSAIAMPSLAAAPPALVSPAPKPTENQPPLPRGSASTLAQPPALGSAPRARPAKRPPARGLQGLPTERE